MSELSQQVEEWWKGKGGITNTQYGAAGQGVEEGR